MNYKDDYLDDNIQLVAEYMAFDSIYYKYNYEMDVIQKAKVVFNINNI